MPRPATTLAVLFLSVLSLPALSEQAQPKIPYPQGWQNWATIAVSQRTDNNTLRTIVGNDIAVEAARQGRTAPWPDGAILGKVVWKNTQHQTWPAAIAPGDFVHAEFMFKDSEKYKNTYGWGWARWVGMEQTPFDKAPQVCIACHTPVKNRDWVFTDPAQFPPAMSQQ